MIGQSDLRPQAFEVNELTNGMAEIMFFENIAEKEIIGFEQETKTIYEFDMYELSVQARSGLKEDIESNYQDWLSFAKGQGQKPISDKEKIAMLEERAIVTEDLLAELILGGM